MEKTLALVSHYEKEKHVVNNLMVVVQLVAVITAAVVFVVFY